MSRPSSIATALVLSAVVTAQEPAEDATKEPPTLTVSAEASVRSTPDKATLRLGAVVQAAEAQAAQQQVNQALQQAIAAIGELGIPAERLQTVDLSIAPVYSNQRADDGTGTPRIVGYRASNTLQVDVRDLALVGKVVDAGVVAGLNRIEHLSYGLADATEARLEALQKAVAKARREAEAIAGAMEHRIAGVRQVREGGVALPEPRAFDMAMARMETSTPVQPGEVEVHASVTIEYRIEPTGDADDQGGTGRAR